MVSSGYARWQINYGKGLSNVNVITGKWAELKWDLGFIVLFENIYSNLFVSWNLEYLGCQYISQFSVITEEYKPPFWILQSCMKVIADVDEQILNRLETANAPQQYSQDPQCIGPGSQEADGLAGLTG